MKKSSTELIWITICTKRKDGLSGLWFCKNRQWNSLLKTSVSVKILTVGSCLVWRYQRAYKRPQRLTNANSLKLRHDFLGKVMAFDNVGGVRPHGRTTPHMHTKITPVIYDEKKNKYRHSVTTCSIERTKILHKGLSVTERVRWRGVYENKREDERLLNKSIKELKAENKELAEKIAYVCRSEKQNEEIKRLKRERARTYEWIAC